MQFPCNIPDFFWQFKRGNAKQIYKEIRNSLVSLLLWRHKCFLENSGQRVIRNIAKKYLCSAVMRFFRSWTKWALLQTDISIKIRVLHFFVINSKDYMPTHNQFIDTLVNLLFKQFKQHDGDKKNIWHDSIIEIARSNSIKSDVLLFSDKSQEAMRLSPMD